MPVILLRWMKKNYERQLAYLDERPNLKSQISNLESRIPNLKSRISNPESRIPNPESRISNLKSRIPNPESRTSNPESRIPNLKSRIPNPESRISHAIRTKFENYSIESRCLPLDSISNFGHRISDFGLRTSNFGFRISDFGLRISNFGFRTSDFGKAITLPHAAFNYINHHHCHNSCFYKRI
jgi:hypothetical protein